MIGWPAERLTREEIAYSARPCPSLGRRISTALRAEPDGPIPAPSNEARLAAPRPKNYRRFPALWSFCVEMVRQ